MTYYTSEGDHMTSPYQPYNTISAVAKAFQLSADALTKGRRTPYRTRARWAAAFLLRLTGTLSWGDVARLLAYNDHTSALNAARAAETLCARDPYYRDVIRGLQVQLKLPILNEQTPTTQV